MNLSDNLQLKPAAPLEETTLLLTILLIALALILAIIITVIVLSQPRKVQKRRKSPGSHSGMSATRIWHKRIDSIVNDYHANTITKNEAFTQLALLSRDFASTASGNNMNNRTLYDLNFEPRHQGNQRGLDLLKQTIGALYQPEFADERYNLSAQQTTVEQAAEWVSKLVERWR